MQRGNNGEDKVKQSNFFITLNTNISPSSEMHERDLVKQLGRGIGKMVTEHEDMKRIIKFLIPGHVYSSRYVLSTETEYAVEKGNKQKRLHVHIWLNVEHKSKIHLDLRELKKVASERTGVNVPYCNVRVIRKNPFQNVRDYLRKANLYQERPE